MAYGESNGHVTDDLTWPKRSGSWPDTLRAKKSRKRLNIVLGPMRQPIRNGVWRIEWLLTWPITSRYPEKGNVVTPMFIGPNNSNTAGDRGSVPKQRTTSRKMTYGKSNGYVTDDVIWPREVKVLTPVYLGINMWKISGDRCYLPKGHQ